MKMNKEGTTAQYEMPGCWVTRASCNDLGRARSTLSELCRQENYQAQTGQSVGRPLATGCP
jgi:hypothetical protein